MIARKIRPEEFKKSRQLSALVFEYGMSGAKLSSEALMERTRLNPRGAQDVCPESQWAAFEDDDSTMMATMGVIPWTANFDGHAVPMGGVAGVATLPQYRRRGAVCAMFAAALREMYEGGACLSYLHPFSTAFYRQFGYGPGCDRVSWRLALSRLDAPEAAGTWRLSELDAPLEDAVRAVNAAFWARYNCMARLEGADQLFLREDPFTMKRYTYVYFDAEGRPRAWLTAVPVKGEVECEQCAFDGREGMLGVLSLLKRLAADHDYAVLHLPEDADLRGLIGECADGAVARTVRQWGMVRAVNVEALLRLARARGEGTLRVAVTDDMLPENAGCFEVRFAPGRENEVVRTGAAPDIALTIQDFSRLITGCAGLDAQWLPEVKLNGAEDVAARLFYKKPVHISAFF